MRTVSLRYSIALDVAAATYNDRFNEEEEEVQKAIATILSAVCVLLNKEYESDFQVSGNRIVEFQTDETPLYYDLASVKQEFGGFEVSISC